MLEIDALEVRYGTRVAVAGVSLAVGRGDVLSVVGPSGSGKTTLLRAVAGLEPPAAGTVAWDGTDITRLPPHRRGFGFVFQNFALFPHRDVAGNVVFGLRMDGAPRAAAAERVREVLDLVGLTGYQDRALSTLSGGEMQRVALARALAPDPGLLLLDEPLGSLDRVLRERLTAELASLLGGLDVAALYVTHDQHEAFALGGRIAVMRDGALVQTGTAEELWRRPKDAFVARFLGFANILTAVNAGDELRLPWGAMRRAPDAPVGDVLVVIPPDALALDSVGEIKGTVRAVAFRGDHFVASIEVSPTVELHVHVRAGATPVAGERVAVSVDSDLVWVVPAG